MPSARKEFLETAGLLGYWATGLLGYWATGLLGYWATVHTLWFRTDSNTLLYY
ncbi:MAG: hypothetical protein ACRCSP_04810 [Rhodoglobus sp.]